MLLGPPTRRGPAAADALSPDAPDARPTAGRSRPDLSQHEPGAPRRPLGSPQTRGRPPRPAPLRSLGYQGPAAT